MKNIGDVCRPSWGGRKCKRSPLSSQASSGTPDCRRRTCVRGVMQWDERDERSEKREGGRWGALRRGSGGSRAGCCYCCCDGDQANRRVAECVCAGT